MKRLIVLTLAIAMMLVLASCSGSTKETNRLEEGLYNGAKIEHRKSDAVAYKIIYRLEDVANLVSNFNQFDIVQSKESMDDWIYKIELVKELSLSGDRQTFEFPEHAESQVVLISENHIQIGDQVFNSTSGHVEVIASKYASWDYEEHAGE